MMLGYQASDSENAYNFFFRFFVSPTDRPTQYQETNSTVNEKKMGMAIQSRKPNEITGLGISRNADQWLGRLP